MELETDPKFTRPGVLLVTTGVVALVLRLFVDSLPLIGGLAALVFLLGGLLAIVGGAVLLVKKSGT